MEFTDGEVTELTINVISEHMYVQCDKDGNDMLLIDYFVDYRKTERLLLLQDQKLIVNGKPFIKRSTVGWETGVLWKYEITTWEKLLDLKDFYPAEVAEYAED